MNTGKMMLITIVLFVVDECGDEVGMKKLMRTRSNSLEKLNDVTSSHIVSDEEGADIDSLVGDGSNTCCKAYSCKLHVLLGFFLVLSLERSP
jgi:hypothetical protein